MKNVRIKNLELTNYRNIEHLILNFDGNSKIIGENRIGKTNTLEAIVYLLSDRLLSGNNDLAGIKPLRDTKLVVSVKGTFEIEDSDSGQVTEVTLKKEYGELWSKTRGTQTMEFKGHFTNYFYNGVKQGTLKAYNQLFFDDFGIHQDATVNIDYIRLVVDPLYLGALGESDDWKNLRAFIIKLVGDVKDEDIFNKEPSIKVIQPDLVRTGGRIDQLKKQFSQERKGIEDSIIGDDSRIKFLEETERPTDDEVEVARKGIQEHDDNIVTMKSNVGVDTASQIIKEKISATQDELVKAITEASKNKTPEEMEIDKLQQERSELLSEQNGLLSSRSKVIASMRENELLKQSKQREVNNCNVIRESTITKLRSIDAEINNPEVKRVCSECGRPLEEADIQKAIELKRERLRTEKETLLSTGKENKAKKERLESEIADIDAKNKDLEVEKVKLDNELDMLTNKDKALSDKINDIHSKMGEKKESPQIADLRNKLENLKQELTESQNAFQTGQQNVNQMILEEEQAKKPFQEVINRYNYYLKQQEELEKAKSVKQEHQDKLMDVEQKIELVNKYICVKLRMLDENVSKVFGKIKFQLIRENINGGFDQVCKPYIYDTVKEESTSTLWKNGSKSEQISTGIAISERIKDALNIASLPYLFDEGGEVSVDTFQNRIKTNAQLVCVEVRDNIMNPLVVKIGE